MAASRVPDASSELEALRADWAEHRGEHDGALLHIGVAAELRPAAWEFARRTAEIHLGRAEPVAAKAVLEVFLSLSQSLTEREAALDLWEMADAVTRGRTPGS